MVDWEPLSKVPSYEKAVSNAFSVATQLADWLSEARAKEFVDFNRTQLVGFSIGSHIVGNAAKRLRGGKMAKIFGRNRRIPYWE